jgi:hypothetical protein
MCECKNVRKAATGCLQTHTSYTSFINFYNTSKSKTPSLSERKKEKKKKKNRFYIQKIIISTHRFVFLVYRKTN